MSCDPKVAHAIVQLLLDDPGISFEINSRAGAGELVNVIPDYRCAGCGEVFETAFRSRQFCSRECYSKNTDKVRR